MPEEDDGSFGSVSPAKGSQAKPVKAWANARLLALVLFIYYAIMLVLMERRLHWTPPIRPVSAAPEWFSEERAMVHVVALAGDLPDRQISMPQLAQAHDYVEAQARALAELAASRPERDVEVEVFRERVTGSVDMDFGGVPFTNAYRGLTNIVMRITPKGTEGRKGLLIAAHHDSAVASPGAADDVSMVAVMLEAARALLSRPGGALPGVPLVLLFDGGEESICQAGHGFFNSSQHARGLGAFINLEAMGGGGLPILFQHTGAWVVAAWARGAPNAHGARIAQDIFDTGIIPGDTDYRMFSARHYGSLPGLDIAFIRDSVAYHSSLDNVERLRPGSLQDIGEGLLGGLVSMASALAKDEGVGKLGSREALRERSVYFDLIGAGMVHYPDSLARLLHTAPLALFIMLPLASVPSGQIAGLVMHRMLAAAGRAAVAFVSALVAPAGLGVACVLVSGRSMSWFAHHWLAYLMFLPLAAAAALRPWMGLRAEALAQRPHQQGHWVACQVYGVGLLLSALAAGLCVAGLQGFSQILAMGGYLAFVLGSLVDNSASTLTPLALCGILAVATAPLAAMGAILGTFLDVMMERMALTGHHSTLLADGVIGALTGSAVLGYSCCSLLPLAGYALGGLFGDGQTDVGPIGAQAGPARARAGPASVGAAARSKRGGPGRPRGMTKAIWSSRRPVLLLLAAVSLGAALYGHTQLQPYNRDNPRRVTITHLHETGSWVPEDDSFAESAARAVAAAASAAAVHPRAPAHPEDVQEPPPSPEEERRELAAQLSPPPPVTSALALGIVDSNTFAQMFPHPDKQPLDLPHALKGAPPAPLLPHHYASLYPLDNLLGKLLLPAVPAREPPVAVPPYVRFIKDEPGEGSCANPDSPSSSSSDPPSADATCANASACAGRVVHFRLFSEAHCWGMLNITTKRPLQRWSLPSPPVAAPLRPAPGTPPGGPAPGYFHMVRFSHEDPSPFWELWVEARGEDPWVVLELSATYLPLTAELVAVRDALPDWVSPTWIGTTYHSSYRF
ncbi:hypothetical protein HYH03_008635 [Edaphochlamys debaryana]|uniref:Peptidase M28 domain-containing protein n=1 Tax=Edaphochlamys debaryana TaxID=47281 RepID=A0A835Y027_9CHLO|nr:hypothetical protein HYH03_008635 [Edaphochlamys debaryana]|eukprot:KAG2493215.1 hypothetical protein HYH03_008635 [Edaphochlamys debaryana]